MSARVPLRIILACVVLAACDRACDRPRSEPAARSGEARSVPMPAGGELTADERRRVAELATVVAAFYPRWNRDSESLDQYLRRYRQAPETVRRHARVAERVQDKSAWDAFLGQVQAALPGYSVQNGTPPFYPIPSYQVVIATGASRGTYRNIVFRFSHLAPVFDYYESVRADSGLRLSLQTEPSPESAPVRSAVHRAMAAHFAGYQALEPRLGAVPMPDFTSPNQLPDSTTLADLLFDEGFAW